MPRSINIDWQNVDWSKSNTELMHLWGVSQPTISKWRKKLGQSCHRDWSKVDLLNDTSEHIAEVMNVPIKYVYEMKNRRKKQNGIITSNNKFDWSQADNDIKTGGRAYIIAKKYNVTPMSVYNRINKLKAQGLLEK